MADNVVVDTSVALSWLLPGEKTEDALLLRNKAVEYSRIKLLIPPIFWFEVANVLWVSVKRERIDRSQAYEALESLMDFQLDVCMVDPVESLSAALANDLTVYDSAYLVVALERQAILWTFDHRLAKAAHENAIFVEPI